MARQVLEEIGRRVVVEAATGADAVQTVRRLRPNLVLLDIQLPDQAEVRACKTPGCADLRQLGLPDGSVAYLRRRFGQRDSGGRVADPNAENFIRSLDAADAVSPPSHTRLAAGFNGRRRRYPRVSHLP